MENGSYWTLFFVKRAEILDEVNNLLYGLWQARLIYDKCEVYHG